MSDESPPLTRFELAARELRALGIVLIQLPGEYRIRTCDGSDAAAVTCSDLDEALALGRDLARFAAATARDATTWRMAHRKPTTAKAIRRRRIRAHNHRVRGRAIKAQRESE